MRPLSPRQEEVLDAIRGHVRRTGIPPSRAELAQALGLTHASTVDWHLMKLAQKGWIELVPDVQRGIRLLDEDLPVIEPVGEVAAGEPIDAASRTADRLPASVADRFRPRPNYFLTVQGDSMDRTGLRDGDLVAVRTGREEPADGTVVVARIDGEVTLKRFYRIDHRTVELRPESSNPAHTPRRIDLTRDELHLDGVAVGALIGKAAFET